jgi:hypothetical protein
MADCGRTRVKSGEELKVLKRTETEVLDEREGSPWLEGGVRRAPLAFRSPEVDIGVEENKIFLKCLRLLKVKLAFFVQQGSHIAVLDVRRSMESTMGGELGRGFRLCA